jgi:hypothetical protein
MDRQYDIFERVDGELVWRAVMMGRELATRKLKELGANSPNEFVVMHVPTKSVIATINSSKS